MEVEHDALFFPDPKKPRWFHFWFTFIRSDPAAFESRLEKRSEFRKQPVGHSRQGDFIKCVEQKVIPVPFYVVDSPVLYTPPSNLILGVGSLMGQQMNCNIASLYSAQSPSINGILLFLASYCGHSGDRVGKGSCFSHGYSQVMQGKAHTAVG